MKRIVTLLLAAGLVLGAAGAGNAADVKVKGMWDFAVGWADSSFNAGDKGDNFVARQRLRTQVDFIASETLKGVVFFEIGDQNWGRANQGASLGTDGTVIEVRYSYIDWVVPNTELKVRMGLQPIAFPGYVADSSVLNHDGAGITLNYDFNENVAATFFWARLENDNERTDDEGKVLKDNLRHDAFDLFGLTLPLTFDGVKVTPWGMYSAIGPNTFREDNDFRSGPWGAGSYAKAGLFPVMGALHKDGSSANGERKLSSYGDAWWAGLTGEVTAFDPFRFAWDFNYGSVTWDDDGRLNRSGWLASLLFEYKLDWATPGLYGWYGSGDDSNPANGSERMPTLSATNTNNFSNFAFDGDPYIARDGAIGHGMGGTWGIGARLKDMSFVEDLKHTFRVNYIGGTNSPSMGKKLSLNDMYANSGEMGMEAMYLTTQDSALEIGLSNTYQMYENFVINVEADYIALWLDTSKSVWGARHRDGKGIPQTNDAWNINASFVYSF